MYRGWYIRLGKTEAQLMSRKAKRTISMCAIFVITIALAGVYFLRRNTEEYEDDTPPATTMVTVIQREEHEVTRVTFISEEQNYAMVPYIDENDTVIWQWEPSPEFILQPMQARELVRPAWMLNAMDIAHEDSAGLDLAQFGLNPPHLQIEAIYADGTRTNIFFGTQTADMRQRFVMISGDPAIYLVANHIAERSAAGIESVIDRSVQNFTVEAERILVAQRDLPIIELSMTYAAETIDALAAIVPITPDGQLLRLVRPMDIGIDHSRLQYRVLGHMETFRLDSVVSLAPYDLSPYGLDNPSLVFAYQDAVGETHLFFGDTFVEEINGWEIEFIYVKFADRPHVFRAEFEPVSVLFNLNIFSFIERFVALVSILDAEAITITAQDESRNLEMIINHEESHVIHPTINGVEIEESDFRVAYRLIIALSMEGEIEPFTPQGTPDITIVYHMINDPDIELRFFAVDANFYAVSVDGADAWFVTGARDVNVMFNFIAGIM
jgi:hypothetical protein